MKICLACSAGGHLTELLQVARNIKGNHKLFFLTYRQKDSEGIGFRTEFVECVTRNPLTLIKNIIQSFGIIAKEKPDLIISTGAGVAVPAMYWGKLFGAKIVFIETFCMPTQGSLSGRFIYPIADKFFLQWKEVKKHYGKKAEFWGPVF